MILVLLFKFCVAIYVRNITKNVQRKLPEMKQRN